ncbi:MAG: hypothetical protein WA885_05465 [Phormidesmis sp.]
MASSADSIQPGSIQQRYSAGGCVLAVSFQPSALSQWYPKPIAQDLTFKLWLTFEAEETFGNESLPTLVAEGDHTALQALSQYFQQQVQASLVIANPNSRIDRSAPQPGYPPSWQSQRTLSTLQLCDLNTVLTQCEQTICALPIALSIADSGTSLSAAPSASATSAQSQQSPRRNVIPFRSRRSTLWASSAAVALFAIGLTTALWPRPSNQELSTSPNSTLNELEVNESEVNESEVALSPEPPVAADTILKPPNKDSGTAAEDPQTASPESENARVNQPGTAPPPSLSDSLPNSSEDLSAAPVTPPPKEKIATPAPPSTSAGRATAQREAEALPELSESADSAADGDLAEPFAANAPAPAGPPNARQQSPMRVESQAEAGIERINSEAAVIAEVKAYFEAQWQSIERAAQTSLMYRLQLSESGEVISFVAVNQAAEAARDRLNPTANSPTFSPTGSNTDLVLNVVLTANGQVQVSKM